MGCRPSREAAVGGVPASSTDPVPVAAEGKASSGGASAGAGAGAGAGGSTAATATVAVTVTADTTCEHGSHESDQVDCVKKGATTALLAESLALSHAQDSTHLQLPHVSSLALLSPSSSSSSSSSSASSSPTSPSPSAPVSASPSTSLLPRTPGLASSPSSSAACSPISPLLSNHPQQQQQQQQLQTGHPLLSSSAAASPSSTVVGLSPQTLSTSSTEPPSPFVVCVSPETASSASSSSSSSSLKTWLFGSRKNVNASPRSKHSNRMHATTIAHLESVVPCATIAPTIHSLTKPTDSRPDSRPESILSPLTTSLPPPHSITTTSSATLDADDTARPPLFLNVPSLSSLTRGSKSATAHARRGSDSVAHLSRDHSHATAFLAPTAARPSTFNLFSPSSILFSLTQRWRDTQSHGMASAAQRDSLAEPSRLDSAHSSAHLLHMLGPDSAPNSCRASQQHSLRYQILPSCLVIPFFECLDTERLKLIGTIFARLTFAPNELIMRDGIAIHQLREDSNESAHQSSSTSTAHGTSNRPSSTATTTITPIDGTVRRTTLEPCFYALISGEVQLSVSSAALHNGMRMQNFDELNVESFASDLLPTATTTGTSTSIDARAAAAAATATTTAVSESPAPVSPFHTQVAQTVNAVFGSNAPRLGSVSLTSIPAFASTSDEPQPLTTVVDTAIASSPSAHIDGCGSHSVHSGPTTEGVGSELALYTLSKGDHFNSFALLEDQLYPLTARARDPTTLLHIPSVSYEHMLQRYPSLAVTLTLLTPQPCSVQLRAIPFLAGVSDCKLQLLGSLFEVRRVPPGIVLFSQGDDADGVYYMVSGRVEVTAPTSVDYSNHTIANGSGSTRARCPLRSRSVCEGGGSSGHPRTVAAAVATAGPATPATMPANVHLSPNAHTGSIDGTTTKTEAATTPSVSVADRVTPANRFASHHSPSITASSNAPSSTLLAVTLNADATETSACSDAAPPSPAVSVRVALAVSSTNSLLTAPIQPPAHAHSHLNPTVSSFPAAFGATASPPSDAPPQQQQQQQQTLHGRNSFSANLAWTSPRVSVSHGSPRHAHRSRSGSFPFGASNRRERSSITAHHPARGASGNASANAMHLCTLTDGAVLGEIALLCRTCRTATVMTAQESTFVYLSRERFARVVSVAPEILRSPAFTSDMQMRIGQSLKAVPLFASLMRKSIGPLTSFDESRLSQLGRLFSLAHIDANEVLAQEGVESRHFYIVLHGSLSVLVRSDKGDSLVHVSELGPFDYFGEHGLLGSSTSTFTVRAQTVCLCLRLAHEHFSALCALVPDIERLLRHTVGARTAAHLRRIPFFNLIKENKPWSKIDLLGNLFQLEEFGAGDVVFAQGDPADKFYILLAGVAVTTIQNTTSAEPRVLNELHANDYFGEVALLKHTMRTATVTCKSDCVCLSLILSRFQSFLSMAPEMACSFASVLLSRTANVLRLMPLYASVQENKPWNKMDLIANLHEYEQLNAGDVLFDTHAASDRAYLLMQGSLQRMSAVGGHRGGSAALLSVDVPAVSCLPSPAMRATPTSHGHVLMHESGGGMVVWTEGEEWRGGGGGGAGSASSVTLPSRLDSRDRLISAPSFVGIEELYMGTPHVEAIVVEEQCVLLSISRANFRHVLAVAPELRHAHPLISLQPCPEFSLTSTSVASAAGFSQTEVTDASEAIASASVREEKSNADRASARMNGKVFNAGDGAAAQSLSVDLRGAC